MISILGKDDPTQDSAIDSISAVVFYIPISYSIGQMSRSTVEGGMDWVQRADRRRGGALVDCIILAEFDIDTGSTVRHQVSCVFIHTRGFFFV